MREDYLIAMANLVNGSLLGYEDRSRVPEYEKKVDDYVDSLEQENQKYKEVIDKAIEYINKYAWQEDIIGGIYTTNGKPATDRYMKLEWDNCNELLDILNEVE